MIVVLTLLNPQSDTSFILLERCIVCHQTAPGVGVDFDWDFWMRVAASSHSFAISPNFAPNNQRGICEISVILTGHSDVVGLHFSFEMRAAGRHCPLDDLYWRDVLIIQVFNYHCLQPQLLDCLFCVVIFDNLFQNSGGYEDIQLRGFCSGSPSFMIFFPYGVI